MKLFPILLIVFGILVIVFPEIIAYLVGAFFIFVGIMMLQVSSMFSKSKKGGEESYVKFGNYKIYR